MIPLLSPRPLAEFTPEEYKLYVVSMYREREKTAPKRKKLKDLKVRAKVKKNGLISIVSARDPKYLTEEEATEIGIKLERPDSEVFIALCAAGFTVMTHREAEAIRAELKEIPF